MAALAGGQMNESFTKESKISDVVRDAAFGDYGRLLFPTHKGYFSGGKLGELNLTWYEHIDADKTVEILNYLKDRAKAGKQVFYDIYSNAEKIADPRKNDTGLFYFKGEQDKPFAVVVAGGGFAYVGAMHDSFPHALELSKKGYNAFALIYRPGARSGAQDLARAISFIFEHAKELEVGTEFYSLWGGSAGARLAAMLGSYGTQAFEQGSHPRPAALIMQYTGYSDFTRNDPPTFAVVGENDWIASPGVMERRIRNLATAGVKTQFRSYANLGHGFGLGTGTTAQGWLDEAVKFWQEQMR